MLYLAVYNHTRSRIGQKVFFDLLKPAEKILLKEKIISHRISYAIELSLVGNVFMRHLNKAAHKKDRPTDVISLSYFSAEPSTRPSRSEAKQLMPSLGWATFRPNLVGEIFICVPFAIVQARRIGQSLKEELRFLFVHGLLHIFGLDHKKPAEETYMKNLAYRILGRIRR